MKVPLLDLPRQYQNIRTAVEAAVLHVLESGHYILGEEVRRFESEIAARSGVKHAIGLSSGSDALLAALMALGVGPGHDVVTTTFSFFATAGAIARLGARPVFCDIEPDSFNLDARDALRRVGSSTRAIIPVHLFGRTADTAALSALGIPIVEDAAQALDGARVGKLGICATLSFFPSKNLGAAGDAGMVLTDDDAFAEQLRLLRSHGSQTKYLHTVVGGNFRIDAIQAAILRAKLPFLSAWNARRRDNAARYRQGLAGTLLGLPADAPGHVWHHFVVRSPARDALRQWLAERDVESAVYYPHPLHLQPCFAHLGGQPGDLPHAERAACEALALPVHADLTDDQIDYVCEQVRAFHQKA